MTDQPIAIQGFHHLAMRVRDFDASVRFYTQALGFTSKITWGEGDKRAIMLDCGNSNYLEIFAGAQADRPEGVLLHFALRTTDVDGAVQRAVAAGAEVTLPPANTIIPAHPAPVPVRYAFLKGLDGEIIEFFDSEAV